MDLFQSLALGFGQALAPANFVWCLVGVLVGTLESLRPERPAVRVTVYVLD